MVMGSNCEHCSAVITVKYASGRFCSSGCARAFSTKKKRSDINAKLSAANKGKRSGNALITVRKPMSEQQRKVHSETMRSLWSNRPFDELSFKLKRRAVVDDQNGICAACNNVSTNDWNGQPISLQIDHIDGDRTNNTRPNLRALCPNCHSQTATWGIRNMRMSPAEWKAKLSVASKKAHNRKSA